jgi:hypothetical protein
VAISTGLEQCLHNLMSPGSGSGVPSRARSAGKFVQVAGAGLKDLDPATVHPAALSNRDPSCRFD